jgi:hypothetical protein
MRRAAKRDANEKPIVDALEACGYSVFRHLPCDLLVPMGYGGLCRLLEVKMPSARPRKDQLTQREFLALTGTSIVRTPEEAIRAVGPGR